MSRVVSAPRVPALNSRQRSAPERPAWDLPAKVGILIFSAFSLGYAIKSGALFTSFGHLRNNSLHQSFFWMTIAWGAICYAALVWRVRLWLRYRPMESVSNAKLPSVTVIIPAFNEGALVRQSIRSVANNRYPAEKLQIIIVDDGSTDDTWEHIEAAVASLPDHINVMTLRHARNMGKRRALYDGFRHATGEAIVTVDSDTILEPAALRNGVTPLVREPEIGAVAGCVEVLNPSESVFTRFLKTTFSLSFKFVRAYQSEIRGVFCTPGAISIYRGSVVRKVADEWLKQTFLGMPCTIGEDRAMTNLILREGWLTSYQENARVWSKMPTNYVGMTKMLLRWARSNIRETIALNRFLFTPFRKSKRYLASFRLNMVLVLATLFVPYLLISNSWALIFTNWHYALRHAGMVVVYGLTMAAIYYRNERDSDWIWLLFYELFWVTCLAWIMPYAAVSLRKTGWLTRGVTQPKPADQTRSAALPMPATIGANALEPLIAATAAA